jgi:hypothetical protein
VSATLRQRADITVSSLGSGQKSILGKYMRRNWLIDFIGEAAEKNWCNRLWCTTCGALEFRSQLACRVCVELGMAIPEPRKPGRPSFIHDFRDGLDIKAVESVARHLASISYGDLSKVCDPRYAEHSIGMILYEIGVMPDQPLIFQSQVALRILEGTEVGNYVNKWRAHVDRRDEEKRQRAEYQSPEATARRREERRRAHAAASDARRAGKSARDNLRTEFLQTLVAMSAVERLSCLANGAEGWPLDAIPRALLENLVPEAQSLPSEQRRRLTERIGRRKGAWQRLKKRLEISD